LTPPLHFFPTGPTKAIWQKWILDESAQRTFLACSILLAMHCVVLKGSTEYCEADPMFLSAWTVSSHLWHASSVLDFALAINEKNRFIVKNWEWSTVLSDGSPEDFDLMAKAVFVGKYGIDDAKAWFYAHGSQL
jgi:hypothetical protein